MPRRSARTTRRRRWRMPWCGGPFETPPTSCSTRRAAMADSSRVIRTASVSNAIPRRSPRRPFARRPRRRRRLLHLGVRRPPPFRLQPPVHSVSAVTGATRQTALEYCRRLGIVFSGLSSSWAPFIVAAASKLRAGGRIAFVVPAEIGHAPYARPLMDYLVANFGSVHLVAIKEKIFPRLSADCWLPLTTQVVTGRHCRSSKDSTPTGCRPCLISVEDVQWRGRLRPLLPARIRSLYERMAADPGAVRLGRIALAIGYVSGANRFFHLRVRRGAFGDT